VKSNSDLSAYKKAAGPVTRRFFYALLWENLFVLISQLYKVLIAGTIRPRFAEFYKYWKESTDEK
jgi:hypothetical protein